jgi:hypothetical protein
MDEEQAVGVVSFLDCSEARVVATPVRLLPSFLGVIALAHVRTRVRNECTKLTHTSVHTLCGFATIRN